MFKKISKILCVLCFILCLASCAAKNGGMGMAGMGGYSPEMSEEYLELNEKGFINTAENNKLNVSMDSSNAAY